MKQASKFFLATVIGVIILSVFSNWIYDNVKTIPVLKWVGQFFVWVWTLLNHEVKIWVVLIIILGMIFMLILITSEAKKNPPFLDWTSDRLEEWHWSWQWHLTSGGWDVINLVPHCPKDATKMMKVNSGLSGIYYRCPKCKTDYDGLYPNNHKENESEIYMLIHDELPKRFPKS